MKRSLLVQFVGAVIIAFVAGVAVGGYVIPSQVGSQFGGYQVPQTKIGGLVAEPYKPIPIVHQVVPTELGCHLETTPGKLTKTPCLTKEEIAKYPHPVACTGATGNAPCGMQSTVSSQQQAFGINSIPVREAYLEVTMQQYSSSVDPSWGSGAYSLQMNTNFFTGNNFGGAKCNTVTQANCDWVQFVYQNFLTSGQGCSGNPTATCPTSLASRFCVWNININPSTVDYNTNTVCTGYVPVPITARAQFVVGGYTLNGLIYGWMHWVTLNTDLKTVCSTCPSGTVWAVASDAFGLASNWVDVSGTILGAGGASVLNFAGYAVVQNVLVATACGAPATWTCLTPQVNVQYSNSVGGTAVTGETNNLVYAPNPNWVAPQVPQSTLACSTGSNAGYCWLTAYEIFPNAG